MRLLHLKSSAISKRGFTILEIMVVIAVIGILSVIGLVTFTSSRDTRQLTATAQNILGVLRSAQAKTLAGEGGTAWGVHLSDSRFVLFQGVDFGSAVYTENYDIPAGLAIGNINLAGGATDIIFNRVDGGTNQYGIFSVEVKNSSAVFSISVDKSGKVYQTSAAVSSLGTRMVDTRRRNFNLGWSIKNGVTLTLTFSDPSNPDVVLSVPMANYFNADRSIFAWSDTPAVGGQTQNLHIYTTSLTDTNTTLAVDRDCRKNTKELKVTIDSKDIATYSADCQTVTAGPYGGSISEP